MATRQYIGARYVPKFADPLAWNDQTTYEALTIVTYNGASYTSKKTVPPGTLPTNTDFWVLTGNYNAQVEQYREIAEQVQQDVDDVTTKLLLKGTRNVLICDETFQFGDMKTALEGYGGDWTVYMNANGKYGAENMTTYINTNIPAAADVDNVVIYAGHHDFGNTFTGDGYTGQTELGGYRTNIAGSVYTGLTNALLKLYSLFTNAKIYVALPFQTKYNVGTVAGNYAYAENALAVVLSYAATRLGVNVINTLDAPGYRPYITILANKYTQDGAGLYPTAGYCNTIARILANRVAMNANEPYNGLGYYKVNAATPGSGVSFTGAFGMFSLKPQTVSLILRLDSVTIDQPNVISQVINDIPLSVSPHLSSAALTLVARSATSYITGTCFIGVASEITSIRVAFPDIDTQTTFNNIWISGEYTSRIAHN